NGTAAPKRVLIIGPGSDFAPRTDLRDAPATSYQPRLLREMFPAATIDCVDLNPRVVRAAAKDCDSSIQLDIGTSRLDRIYDTVIATNVLLYLDQPELLLAFQNIRAMLVKGGAFIHNDARFETKVFGQAVDLPAVHFGSVTLDADRRPVLTDRWVIHRMR
ncbi:MAG TPA: class I SAM-dependent methyltransferase, partial [Bryobacteraceae bacterium]|nr:class I SAM-dependent methyltransferase [Bryobacteraceae bacterium]